MAIEISGMAPLLQVFDMPASLAFYRDKLDFKVVSDSGNGDNSGWVMLQRDGVQIMLNTQYEDDDRPPEPDSSRQSCHDDTCLYFGCPNVDAAYEFLKSQGTEIDPPSLAAYGMKQLYLRDPDGYNLCFQWPIDE